ncbi:Variant-surface-glycoprotein phospholipase C [Novymonas esmeraldas]|uniref:Variant-surface-glycoprotein phospholipase C n=1 Tax=Novymonas esmeraldas TaxID=1808958 RepID=A0AAW0ESU5_9TRYP
MEAPPQPEPPSGVRARHETAREYRWKGHSWMWDVRDAIESLSIAQVVMVGTHNAATSDISWRSRFGRDAPGSLGGGGPVAAVARLFAGGFLGAWTRCQQMSVEAQLRYGIRYIDLRIAPHPTRPAELYTTHGLLSVRLADVLQTVRRFLADDASSHEVVLLDLQHVFLTPSEPGYVELFRLLAGMQDLCVPTVVDATALPLRALWASTARVFVFLGCECAEACTGFVHRRDAFLRSPWKNESTTRGLLRALAEDPPAADARVFVTQAVLTPDSKTVTRGLLTCGIEPGSVRALAKRCNRRLVEWFWQRNSTSGECAGEHRNVLMLDYPEMCDMEVSWDGGSLRGSVVDVCVYLNLLRASPT